ncbi:hypothetical protein RSO41_12640 [Halomonas sp. I1]|uniref:hypothetical protein n=1 Tax=Halomonas sp. I1 TaxID=393536 RepID=UPI0028E04607|nr:hypothetical protein [Halomonas sp. I1]MDT8895504.1 hypothetical protein [Halomonas sp. I1]
MHACSYGLVSLAIAFFIFLTPVGVFVLDLVSNRFSDGLEVVYSSLGREIEEEERLVGFANLALVTSLSVATVVIALVWSLCWKVVEIKDLYPEAWCFKWWVPVVEKSNARLCRYKWYRSLNDYLERYKSFSHEVRGLKELENLRKSVEDSPLELFLYRSFLTNSLIQVSVKNDKVYVGIIVGMGDPDGGETFKEIALLPIMSGFRDKDERGMYLPNDYPQFFHESPDKMMDAIYIPREEIYSYGGFDPAVYDQVSGGRNSS